MIQSSTIFRKAKTRLVAGLLSVSTAAAVAAPPQPVGAVPETGPRFVVNHQQWEPRVLFAADVPGGRLILEHGRLVQSLYDTKQLEELHHHSPASDARVRAHAYSVSFQGAATTAAVRGEEATGEVNNYFLGRDESRWAANVPLYGAVRYQQLYPGTDLRLYTKDKSLEYDFELAPGADAARIQLRYQGQQSLRIENGALHVRTSVGKVVEQRPYAYQLLKGVKVRVACEYILGANQTVSFRLPQGYDHSRQLVIDPVLVYSSYTGSSADNYGYTATFDSLGNLYAGGVVFSSGFPTTMGAYDVSYAGSQDIGIMKFNPDATTRLASRVYATYIGGTQADHPHSLVVDRNNNLIILGSTDSNNYPVTPTGFDRSLNGTDIVVTKLNATGTALVGSTFLGGSGTDGQLPRGGSNLWKNYGDQFRGDVITDRQGNIYLTSVTESSNFPLLGAFQTTRSGTRDAVVVKLNSGLTGLVWSTLLGGSNDDMGYSMQLDSLNNVFVSGGTSSTNFPGTATGFRSSYQGGPADGFVARISSGGDDLVQSTYLGTQAYDQAHFVQLNRQGEVYVYGQTLGAYPVTAGVYSNPGSRQFIQKLNARLTTGILSTVVGNGPNASDVNLSPTAFLVDNCGQILLSGWGGSSLGESSIQNMPVTPNAIQASISSGDYHYVMQLSANAQRLVYGTYFGNGNSHVDGGTSRFDKRGIIYQSMCIGSGAGMPVTPNAYAPTKGSGSYNNAAFKIDVLQLDARFVQSVVPNGPRIRTGCAPLQLFFERRSVAGTSATWDFGNGQTSTSLNSVGALYTTPGRYFVRLTVFDTNNCVQSVTAVDTVDVYGLPRAAAGPDRTLCPGGNVSITVPDAGTGVVYTWFPSAGLNTSTGRTVVATPTANTFYIVRAVAPNGCVGADTVLVSVAPALRLTATASAAGSSSTGTNALAGEEVRFTSTTQAPASSYRWDFGDGETSTLANPTHRYARTGTYQVRLTANFGSTCSEQALVPVVVKQVEVPNIITPGTDGLNDTFRPFVTFDPVDVKIYNRWGRQVFEQKSYVDGWGKDAAPGIYYYLLESASGQTWKGWLEVAPE